MSIRDDVVPILDEVRRDIIDTEAGLRRSTTTMLTRTWSGSTVGAGSAGAATVTTFDPRPRVRTPSTRRRAAEPGRFEDGDVLVDRLSVTYAEAALKGEGLGASVEHWYEIDGQPYSLIRADEGYLGWELQLRPRRMRA